MRLKKELIKENFFILKKVSEENYEKLIQLGDKSIEPRDNLIRIKEDFFNFKTDILKI